MEPGTCIVDAVHANAQLLLHPDTDAGWVLSTATHLEILNNEDSSEHNSNSFHDLGKCSLQNDTNRCWGHTWLAHDSEAGDAAEISGELLEASEFSSGLSGMSASDPACNAAGTINWAPCTCYCKEAFQKLLSSL